MNKLKNYKIDWESITEQEACEILDSICCTFNVLAKVNGQDKLHDVSYLDLKGSYDDDFHSML